MADRPRLKTPFDAPPASAPTAPKSTEAAPAAETRRFRFGTRVFFGLTFVLAVAAAGYGGMANHGDNHAYYVMLTLMSPLAALAVAAAAHKVMRRLKSRRPPSDPHGPFDS